MKDFNSILNEKFKDKEFSKSYHRTATFYRLADELLLLRKKRGLSQKELAEKAGTTQAVVSRLENASVKASLESVVKFAESLDAFVDLKFVPLEDARNNIEDTLILTNDNSEISMEIHGNSVFHAQVREHRNDDKFASISWTKKASFNPKSVKITTREYA